MKITFHGAAQTVTGSQHLLEINGHRLLLECGFYQGKRAESYERNLTLPYEAKSVDAVILSHAHIDHSGNLPNLVKSGYHGKIYTTPASAHLANIMLLDSGHIQEQDVEYVNKKRFKRGEPSIQPIYTLEDAGQVAQYFEPVDYMEPFEPVPGVTAHLVDAGHILGSAAVVLDIEEKGGNGSSRMNAGRKTRVWFSGDIGRRNLPLIQDPVLPEGADIMIMECTYGDKPHSEPQAALEEMCEVVKRTVERGGKVIVPAFAVGRTQEIVYALHQMIDAGDLPPIPVYVDSPLAVNASKIFQAHPEVMDAETREFVRTDRHKAALGFDLLTYTRSVEESKALNDRTDPMVIISASGMAETGRILHHLRHNVENPRNTVMIVSWQAPNTLGRRLADREREVVIFGETYQRRAEVATIGGLSAHAGQTFLIEYALAVKSSVKQIFLVHGEATPAQTLTEKLAEREMRQVLYPGMHTSVEV
jgi:metallo-beta-lactamase family protein